MPQDKERSSHTLAVRILINPNKPRDWVKDIIR